MQVDLKRYEVNKPFIIRWLNKNKQVERVYAASLLSAMTFCPVIVVAYYIGEHESWPDNIRECIKRLQKFYSYDIILNKPDGAPV